MKAALFLTTFCVYILTAFPALAPYRDSGEMTSVSATLGVAHPPGYPLYILAANIAGKAVPFGNYAYRITALSALFMAGAAALFFSLIKKTFDLKDIPAAGAALGFAFSYFYWYLAVVQEMYTMSVFLILAASCLLLNSKIIASFFVLGVAAGARTDAALVYPAFVLYAASRKTGVKKLSAAHIALAGGLSIFLYSWVRAQNNPLINWGDTSTMGRLMDSLLRRSHGGALDLISGGFKSGENFYVQIKYYALHLFRDFTPAVAVAAVVGAVQLYRRKIELFLFAAAGFVVSGVIFIYLANMPPNTHALAILEAHFLLPDIFFCIFAASGAGFLFSKIRDSGGGKTALFMTFTSALGACVYLVAIWIFASSLGGVNKRRNFFLPDYARNISASAANAAVVIKEDVQVFSLWHRRYAQKLSRPDLNIVAAGLAGSGWYKKMNEPWNVILTPLRTADDWKRFISANNRVFFSNDAEFPPADIATTPYGLLNFAGAGASKASMLLDDIYFYRGDFRYGSHREFFAPDIIEDYAKAWHREGFYLMTRGQRKEAAYRFLVALKMREDFPVAAYHLGWCHFAENDFAGAMRYYKYATILYARYVKMAENYRAAPDVKESVRREAAVAWLHRGVTAERLGLNDEALESYSRATELSVNFAMAFYNKAVIYWKKGDFASAKANLIKTVELDPTNADAKRYLSILEGGRR
ncbi:MAG: DUF2723 domain-containing protein [Endomicrobiia bacterium]|nr:DUF2723 domain-containing protein [Endomicrobiia bacterium]